jgi:hypothetical protein
MERRFAMTTFQQQRDKAIVSVALGLGLLVFVALALGGWASGTCW